MLLSKKGCMRIAAYDVSVFTDKPPNGESLALRLKAVTERCIFRPGCDLLFGSNSTVVTALDRWRFQISPTTL